MCGIFGIVVNKSFCRDTVLISRMVNDLFRLSEFRGKESAGIAILSGPSIRVLKQAMPASMLIRSPAYRDFFRDAMADPLTGDNWEKLAIIGHSRLVTNGAQELNRNNQPVVADGIVGVHNGIIVNDAALWRQFPELRKQCDVDTEIMLRLIRLFLTQTGSLSTAFRKTLNQVRGSVTTALLFEDISYMLLATNTGSLYITMNPTEGLFVFASERFILETFMNYRYIKTRVQQREVAHVKPGAGFLIDLSTLASEEFNFHGELAQSSAGLRRQTPPRVIRDCSTILPEETRSSVCRRPPVTGADALFENNESDIAALRRCTKCILPETMPFIEFDGNGVCNYCRDYRSPALKGETALEALASVHRSKTGRPDCVMGFSGGRDSSYGLHYVKCVLKMTPIAFTYDWGMITDLGRRNQARMCGKLGIEHIIVSADINRKRYNIRKNVLAWLRQPDMGTIPLFMAGDKQYFYHANRLMKQNGVKLNIMCEHALELTHFKHGFCGVRHRHTERSAYNMNLADKLKLALYYGRRFIQNPAFLNSSLLDSLTGYISSYMIPHNYLYLFQYIPWDENHISKTLIREYDWEVATDTPSTWRIGDGTAAFYNYIYYTVAGFTENDTFSSNQIREGQITRDKALRRTRELNRPREESLQWYCETIGLEFEPTIRTINAIPRLYGMR